MGGDDESNTLHHNNGAFILAALHKGLKIAEYVPNSPNVRFS